MHGDVDVASIRSNGHSGHAGVVERQQRVCCGGGGGVVPEDDVLGHIAGHSRPYEIGGIEHPVYNRGGC